MITIGSAPLGQKAGHRTHFYQNRRIEAGDAVMVTPEPNSPGRLWVELGRTSILDEPGETLQKTWSDAVRARHYTASLLKPGTTYGEIYDKYNEYIEHTGHAKETRIHAHGRGYDLMERPGICGEGPVVIRSSMNIAIHLTFAKNGAYTSACGNYLTTDAEPARIHKTSQELIRVVHY